MQQPKNVRPGKAWLLLAILGVLAISGGLVAISREQSHFFAGGFTAEERIGYIVDGSRQPGLSSLTQREFMVDCRNSVILAYQRDLSRQDRNRLATACLDAARSITQSAPASSFAWFAQAHAMLVLGDWEGVNQALAMSQATGPNEGWIARYRVELVEDNARQIAPEYGSRQLADLKTLADNMGPYQNFLARLYVLRPGVRARLTSVVETLPAESQRWFLAAVERARQAQVTGRL